MPGGSGTTAAGLPLVLASAAVTFSYFCASIISFERKLQITLNSQLDHAYRLYSIPVLRLKKAPGRKAGPQSRGSHFRDRPAPKEERHRCV